MDDFQTKAKMNEIEKSTTDKFLIDTIREYYYLGTGTTAIDHDRFISHCNIFMIMSYSLYRLGEDKSYKIPGFVKLRYREFIPNIISSMLYHHQIGTEDIYQRMCETFKYVDIVNINTLSKIEDIAKFSDIFKDNPIPFHLEGSISTPMTIDKLGENGRRYSRSSIGENTVFPCIFADQLKITLDYILHRYLDDDIKYTFIDMLYKKISKSKDSQNYSTNRITEEVTEVYDILSAIIDNIDEIPEKYK